MPLYGEKIIKGLELIDTLWNVNENPVEIKSVVNPN